MQEADSAHGVDAEDIAMARLSDPESSAQQKHEEFRERMSSDFANVPTTGLLAVPGPNSRDPEAQLDAAPEHYVPTRSKLLFLAAYFFLNLFLTLSNKAVLGKARFPWLLTGTSCRCSPNPHSY